MAGLTSLDLSYNELGLDGVCALANSPHMAQLISLDLGGNQLDKEALNVIAQSAYLSKHVRQSYYLPI
jgi:hypothetical protein